MKTYKLIKEYPGSLKLGTEINYSKTHQIYNYNGGNFYTELPKHQVENLPEFWEEVKDKNPLNLEVGREYLLQYIHCKSEPIKVKITRFTKDGYPWMVGIHCDTNGIVSPNCYKLIEEVVEKDYEILSFKREGNFMSDQQRRLATLQKDGSYLHRSLLSTTGGSSLENMMKMSFYKIYSVKRLSDGEVFTVGDYCHSNLNNYGKINLFEISNNKLYVKSDKNHHSTYTCIINNLIKSKQPLFTTEDGVDIFKGDNVHWVCDEFSYFYTKNIDETQCNLINSAKTGDFKIFSTKEAAEEYILMNKPCLSINDVKFLQTSIDFELIRSLKKNVKLKL